MKTYRVYEAVRNDGGGIDGVGGWDSIVAETAEQAAHEFWGTGWDEADSETVIVATDDDTDSFHFYPNGGAE